MKLSSSFLVDKPSYNAPVSSLLVTEKTRKRVKDFLIFQKQEILLVNQHKKTGFKIIKHDLMKPCDHRSVKTEEKSINDIAAINFNELSKVNLHVKNSFYSSECLKGK